MIAFNALEEEDGAAEADGDRSDAVTHHVFTDFSSASDLS